MEAAIFGGGVDGGMQVFLMLSLGDNLQAFFTEILEILTTLFCECASMFLSLTTACILTGMQCSMALPMAPQIYWYETLMMFLS